MLNSLILPPAPRSTRSRLLHAERQQAEVIARLQDQGEQHLADLLDRCQQARRDRQPGQWPRRCRSAGCWACRRCTVRRWWRGYVTWLSGPDVSLLTIPRTVVTTDLVTTVRRLRKALRDIRDRAARTDPRWAAVAMAGMISGDHLVLMVRHDGIDRDRLWSVLKRRWPEIVGGEFRTTEPSSALAVADAVVLATSRRGIEPIRVVIPAQLRAGGAVPIEPMPVLV